MKNALSVGAALLLTTTMAHAVGLDRSNQNIGIIFEEGTYGELSFGQVMPSIEGTDVAGADSGNVGEDFTSLTFGFKTDINDQFSIGVLFDEPYGVDIAYPSAADGGSVVLGGTSAQLDSSTVTALARYKVDSNWSVHGGIRFETLEGSVSLGGLGFGPAGGINGYSVDFDGETSLGYSVGAAYERPEIALRIALTYHSEIDHTLSTSESNAASPLGFFPAANGSTEVTTPAAINLDFQTGIAADTLLFGSIRYAEYSVVQLSPANFAGATGGNSLTDIEDGVSYSLGVGRRFSDKFSGSISVGFDSEGDDDLVSPLSPTNGSLSVGVGGEYKVTDNIAVSGGVRYIQLGDARPATGTPEEVRAEFEDNSAIGVGIRVGYSF